MFENWAADVLANYLGKFVDVQRDRLKISLWGGKCHRAPSDVLLLPPAPCPCDLPAGDL